MNPKSSDAVRRLFEGGSTGEQKKPPRGATPDRAITEVKHAVRCLLEPGTVAELRVLATRRGVVSGYFDDFGKLAESAVNCSGKAPAVYVTLNPVKSELLARCNNRIKEYAKQTTADPDIVRRRWLFIDFDPVRPAGISSNDQEHKDALARAEECKEWLTAQDWPEPILADSGNGAHLLYRIDVENDAQSSPLLQRCLEVLALRFDDERVKVDRTTFNAARICKLYGTKTCKGDETEDRPHRTSSILQCPEQPVPASVEQLKRLAAMLPEADEKTPKPGEIDVARWIKAHGVPVSQAKPWKQGGQIWVLDVCPFNAEHTNKSAFIAQFPNGAISAGCHHNSCQGKTWRDLRMIYEPDWRPDEKGQGGGSKQSARLVSLAEEPQHEMRLFRTPGREIFASFKVGGHRETWPVESAAFRDWLAGTFYRRENSPPSDQAIKEALTVLRYQALYGDEEQAVHTRLADGEGAVCLDLTDKEWRVVRTHTNGHRIASEGVPLFRRTSGMLPLPVPVQGGSLDDLRPLINAPDETTWVLLVAWLVGALNPTGPHTLLAIHGEQGSAKSTTAFILRSLIDPTKAPNRRLPRNEEELMIMASTGWVMAFDNLSWLSPEMSDAFCRLATGGGLSKRKLYTDADEQIFEARRPIILNGIEDIVTRPDLADRSILVHLPPIPDSKRRLEKEVLADFERARPKILGALLNAVAAALRNYDQVELDGASRMADFERWIVAAEEALPWKPGTFIKVYRQNQQEIIARAVDDNAFPAAVRDLTEQHGNWSGTPTELLKRLNQTVDLAVQRCKGWPKSAEWVTRKLTRFATALRRVGIDCQRSKGKERLLSLRRVEQNAVDTVSAADSGEQSPCNQRLASDLNADSKTAERDSRGDLPPDPKSRVQRILDSIDSKDGKKQSLCSGNARSRGHDLTAQDCHRVALDFMARTRRPDSD